MDTAFKGNMLTLILNCDYTCFSGLTYLDSSLFAIGLILFCKIICRNLHFSKWCRQSFHGGHFISYG